jgi:hypothetical protein
LTEEELDNPDLVFTRLFESYDLKDIREYLQEALDLVIEKRFKGREYSNEEDNVRFFFEKMGKVAEAAWLIK